MRKYKAIGVILIILMTAIAMLGVGISLAQDQGDGEPSPDAVSTAPVSSESSAESLSQPDQSNGINEVETAPSEVYNASLRIPGSALRPRENNVSYTTNGNGGCSYATTGDVSTIWNTPVYLPQGATVKYMRLYGVDSSTTSNTGGWFTVYDLYGILVHEYYASSSGSGGTNYWDTSEFTQTIDYASYSYVVNWRPSELGSNLQVCGFRLFYHTPPGAVALPAIMNSITGP
jgi:hypothetical protein